MKQNNKIELKYKPSHHRTIKAKKTKIVNF